MNEEGIKDAKEEEKQGRCWIEQGILRVEVPLFIPNGEYLAYGMLHKAANMTSSFFWRIERETKRAAEPGALVMPNGPVGAPHA